MRDTYLTATVKPVAKDMIDSIAFILRVHHKISGTLSMKGSFVYIDVESGETKCHEDEYDKTTS